MNLKKIAKRVCSGVLAGLTALTVVGSSFPTIAFAESSEKTEKLVAGAGKLEMPKGDEIIARACKLLGAPYTHGKGYSNPYGSSNGSGGTRYNSDAVKQYGVDCSGLVAWTLGSFNLKSSGYAWNNPVPIDTEHWLYTDRNCTQPITSNTKLTWTRTENGVTVTETRKPLKTQMNTKDTPYWETASGDDLPAGSIIIAEGFDSKGNRDKDADHAWIYMGEFKSRDKVIEQVMKWTGLSRKEVEKYVGDGSGKGGTHWRIESTSTTTHGGINYTGVMIDNDTSGKKAGAYKIAGMSVTDVELQMQKVTKDNGVITPVAGKSKTASLADKQSKYGIYASKSDAINDKNRVAVLEIGASEGTASVTVEYKEGGYWARELKAPAGFQLNTTPIYLQYDGVTDLIEEEEFGKIVIPKKFADNLSGTVTFEIDGTDGSHYTKTEKITSGKATRFAFDNLPVYTYAKTNGGAKYAKKAIKYTISETLAVDDNGIDYVTVEPWTITLADYPNNDQSSNDEDYRYVKPVTNTKQILGRIYINKKDNLDGTGIEGAEFAVYPDKEIEIDGETYDSETPITVVTDSNGKAVVDLLPFGTYTIKETKAADGYILTKNSKTLTISESDITQGATYIRKDYTLTNSKQGVSVTIQKIDDKTGKPLEGAEFKIYDENEDCVATLTTDANGKASTSNLYTGKAYIIKETKAPYGYVKTDFEQTLNVKTTNYNLQYVPVNFTVGNTEQEVALTVYKIDSENHEKYLAGAEFEITDPDGNVMGNLVTDENGKATNVGNFSLYNDVEYTITETKAPAGYIANNFSQKFKGTYTNQNLKYSEVKLSVENDKQPVHLNVVKVDANNKKHYLSGAEFDVIDENGAIAGHLVTDKNGEAANYGNEDATKNFELLTNMTYTLKETKAPKGYYATGYSETFRGEFDPELQYVEVKKSVENTPTDYYFTKEGITGDKELEGAHLTVYDANDNVVDTWVSGTVAHRITGVLEEGATYRLHEEIAPDGYVLANDIYFTIENVDGKFQPQRVTMKDDWTKVEISKKKITDGEELEGAHLEIIDENGKVVEEWISKKTPHIINAKLIAGKTYTLRETIAPAGWTKANDISFKVSEDGSVDVVKMVDDIAVGSLKVQKKTETMKDISGIEFELVGTSDIGLEVDLKSTSDDNGVALFTNVPIGTYTLTENGETVSDAYVVADDKDVKVEEGKETETEFFNKLKTGTIKIQKETEGMTDIAGIGFTVSGKSDAGNDVNIYAVTDENGVAEFADVPIGTYTVTEDEKTVPAAYLIADKKEVTVKYAETTNEVFHNDKKKGSIEVQKRTEGMINLEGITFILSGKSDTNEDVYLTATTNADGVAMFDDVLVGTYTITEDGKTVPTAYMVADEQSVTVTYAETAKVDFFNDLKTGELQVQKKTEGMINLEGIAFILSGTSDAGAAVNITAVTDKDGKALFESIPVGTYTLTEDGKTVPAGYLVADEKEVTITYAETTNVEVENEERTGTIEIHKTTEGMLNLEGISFILSGTSDAGRDVKITAITDKDGKAVFEAVPEGTYMITEDGKTVPTAYMVAEGKEVTVTYAETTNVEIKNEEKSGSIKIQKKTEDMTNIKGIKFILKGTSDSGRAIEMSAVTDDKGVATFKNVPIGTYTIYEDGSTVPTGYLVADSQSVTVTYAETTNVTFVNKPDKPNTPPSTPPTTPPTDNPSTGVAGGVAGLMLAGAAATIAVKRRKDEDDK